MKPYTDYEPGRSKMPDDGQDIYVFRGDPELVNFPSTSEVFRAVFENTFYATCIGNGKGETLEANARACKMFGYTPEEMAGLSTSDLFNTETLSYRDYLAVRDATGKAKSVIVGIRKNGERFPCEITSLVFFEDNGERRTINTIQDLGKNYAKRFLG